MSVAQQFLNPLMGGTYLEKVVGLANPNLIGYWSMNELSGSVADNAEGTAARDGAYTGVSLNNSTFKDSTPVGLWDGANDYCDVHSASLGAAVNGAEGSMMIWMQVSGSGVWTDSASRYLVYIEDDNDNYFAIEKSATNNTVVFRRRGGATNSNPSVGSQSFTDFGCAIITWSQAADEVKGYLKGVQVGSTVTGLGTWAGDGTLTSTQTVIGAINTTPSSVFDGNLAHCAIWTTALTAAQILDLSKV